MSKKFIKVLDNYMAKGIKLYLISNEVYVGFNDRMKDPTQILVKSLSFHLICVPQYWLYGRPHKGKLTVNPNVVGHMST